MQKTRKGAIYLLFNDLNARYRFRAARFVQEQGFVPMYPTIVTDFFEVKNGSRGRGVDERTEILRKAEQVWVFGEISATMSDQITSARKLGKEVRYFSVDNGSFREK